jgi:hypothetical protein
MLETGNFQRQPFNISDSNASKLNVGRWKYGKNPYRQISAFPVSNVRTAAFLSSLPCQR